MICKIVQFYIEEKINLTKNSIFIDIDENKMRILKTKKTIFLNTTCNFMEINCRLF